MSARAPTTYNAFIDETGLHPAKDIVTTVPSEVVDDQIFILDQQENIVSDMFYPYVTTSGTFGEVAKYYLESTDVCGVDTDNAGVAISSSEFLHDIYYIAWNSNGTTAGEIKITTSATGTNTNTTAITTAHTSTSTWRALGASLNMEVGGIVGWLKIEARRTSGTGKIFVAAIQVFSRDGLS